MGDNSGTNSFKTTVFARVLPRLTVCSQFAFCPVFLPTNKERGGRIPLPRKDPHEEKAERRKLL
ncbi:hypothetical protein AALD01_17925 [Oscillospiraceae bacterium 21-37]